MVAFPQCRHQVLGIIQQLVLSPGGDDDMGTLLCLMHTAPVLSLELKTHILKVSKAQKAYANRPFWKKIIKIYVGYLSFSEQQVTSVFIIIFTVIATRVERKSPDEDRV